MKKISALAILLLLSGLARAQTTSIALTTAPCNHDGVLTSTFTVLTPPLTVTYYLSGVSHATVIHTGVTTLSDVFTGYSGEPIFVVATDGTITTGGGYSGAPPFTYLSTATPAICPALGTVSTTVTGGTPPYTYQWFDVSTMTTVGSTNPLSVPDGRYGVTITDAAGCVYGDLDQDSAASLKSIPTFTVTASTTNASCTNGTATAVVGSGAVAPLSYSWSNGATTPGLTGLVMGSYFVTVTDAVGCTGYAPASVLQTISITAPITATPATCTASDGSAIAFGSGGVPPYTYVWSNGATTQSQSSLPYGYYSVAVTDANGCIGSGSTFITTSTPVAVSYSTTPTSCSSPTGTATLSISGGTGPYTTTWLTTPIQTGVTATSLPQGNHSFQVVDAMGCKQSGTVIVPPVNVISNTFLSTPALCTLATGSIATAVAGGTTPYSYAWSNGSTTASLTGIASGLYHVKITDAAGCYGTFSEFVPFNSTLGVGLSATNATCIFTNNGSLTATATGGTTPYSYSWTTGGTGSTISSLLPNIPYWVTVTDALGCTATQGAVVPSDTFSSCYCTISGTVYEDANANCTQDAGEIGIQHVKINISGRGYTFTDAAGHYEYKVPSGSYTVTENVLAYYPLSPCQSYSVGVTSVAGTGCEIAADFANTIDTIHDMHISTWNFTAAIPGHTYQQLVILTNNGTIPESNVYAGYAPDGQLFSPSFVPGYFHGSPYWYSASPASIPTIAQGSSQGFLINYTVPAAIPLGTSVVFKDSVVADSPMITWMSDYSPWNNVNYFTTNIVSSYDPNFKEVSPKGTGASGIIATTDSVLEYMVHFQNTGTYMAENIRVVDTLDDNLDWTTLVPIFNSAAKGQVSVDISGSKKVATFMFANINLPPSRTEPVASNGMFTYSVKLKKGLAIGSQIKNTASIYFDYNTPIKTNQTLNTIGSVAGPDKVNEANAASAGTFSIFPNPASDRFTAIVNAAEAGTASITVTDIAGRTMLAKQVEIKKGMQTINMSAAQLAAGTYLVTLQQGNTAQTQKLVILKQ